MTNQGNVVPWLLSARALIHNGCTTGVEAFELGVPALSYRATVNDTYDNGFYRLPNAVSHNCFSFDALRETLRGVLDGGVTAPETETSAAGSSAITWPPRTARSPASAFSTSSRVSRPGAPRSRVACSRRLDGWVTSKGLHALRQIKSVLPGSHNRPEFQRHRYPGMPLEEVAERLARFQQPAGRHAPRWRSSRSRPPSTACGRQEPEGAAMTRPPLIIPVENQVRELDPKLLLAAVAARRGFTSILGSHREIDFRIASFPRGLYLNKSMTDRNLKMFQIMRRLGHLILTWDEEALVHLPPDDLLLAAALPRGHPVRVPSLRLGRGQRRAVAALPRVPRRGCRSTSPATRATTCSGPSCTRFTRTRCGPSASATATSSWSTPTSTT